MSERIMLAELIVGWQSNQDTGLSRTLGGELVRSLGCGVDRERMTRDPEQLEIRGGALIRSAVEDPS